MAKGFNPLAPRFKKKKQFNKAVQRITHNTIKQQVNPIKRQQQSEDLASQARQRETGQYYRQYGNELDDAFHDTRTTLNRLMVDRSGASGEAQQVLAAALAGQREQDRAQATTVGGTAPDPTQSENALLTAFGGAESGLNELSGEFGAGLTEVAGRQDIAGLSRLRDEQSEQARHRATISDLAAQKLGIRQSRPAVRQEVISNLLEGERAAAGQRFQQNLAGKELGLEKKKLAEQKREFNKNLGFQRDQLAAEVRQQDQQLKTDLANATSDAKKQKIQAQIEANQKARDYLMEIADTSKGKNINPHRVLQHLMFQFKLSNAEAKRLMKAAGGPFWPLKKKGDKGTKPRDLGNNRGPSGPHGPIGGGGGHGGGPAGPSGPIGG